MTTRDDMPPELLYTCHYCGAPPGLWCRVKGTLTPATELHQKRIRFLQLVRQARWGREAERQANNDSLC